VTGDAPKRALLDTSAVIDLGDLDPAALPEELAICSITLAELSLGPLVAKTEQERAARQLILQQAEADFDPLPFDAAAARAFGVVAASLRNSSRKPAARSYDALIAAVAISHGLPIFTGNPSDFAGIPGLDVHVITSMRVPREPKSSPSGLPET